MVCIKIEKYHIDYDIFCYYDCNIFVLNVLIYKVIYLCINNLFYFFYLFDYHIIGFITIYS